MTLDDLKVKAKPINHTRQTQLVALVIGSLILAPMLWTHVHQQAFERIAHRAVGTVTYVETRSSGRSTSQHPTISYTTEDGRTRTLTAPDSSILTNYHVNDRVLIFYHPDRPSEAVIAKDNSIATNEVMLLLTCIGSGALICGVLPTLFALFGFRMRRTQLEPLRDASAVAETHDLEV